MSEATLLLRPDRGGDALKTLPALRALKTELPHQEVHLLASEHNASVFEHEPGIKLHVLPSGWQQLPRERWLEELGFSSVFPAYDRVINLLCDPSEDADRLLSAIPAQRKFTARLADEYGVLAGHVTRLELPSDTPAGRPETENIALLLSQVFCTDLARTSRNFTQAPRFSEEDLREADEKMGPKRGRWLGICPMASNSQRSAPLARWRSFLKRVTRDEEFSKFFILGSPADYQKLRDLRAGSARRDDIELLFPSPFRRVGAYLQRLDGVVAVDSGPLHFAIALGIPSLGILAGSDLNRWFDRASESDVLVRRGLFQRHPSLFQMWRAFHRWRPTFTSA